MSELETATETASRMVGRFGGPPATTVLDFGGGFSANLIHAQPGEVFSRPSSAHILCFTIDDIPHHREWRDGRSITDRPVPARAVNVVPAGSAPRAVVGRPFRILHLYIPSSRLDDIASEVVQSPDRGLVEILDPAFEPDPALVTLAAQAAVAIGTDTSLDRLWREALASAICARLLQRWSNLSQRWPKVAADQEARDWRVRRAIDYLEERLADDVGLDEVAAAVGLSPTYLAALFRSATGDPPHRWRMRRRFERACEQLSNRRMSVTEVAHVCGFASSQHLATAFQRRLGMTPTEFRRERLS